MDFSFIQLFTAFGFSICLGLAFALAYEPVRFFHMCGFTKFHHYFITDVFFMIFASLTTYFYCLVTLEGKVRFFVIFGELSGYFLYLRFVAPLTKKFLQPLIKIFKKILLNLLKNCNHLMYNISCRFRKIVKSVVKCFLKLRSISNNKVDGYEKSRNSRNFKKTRKQIKRSKNGKEKNQ